MTAGVGAEALVGRMVGDGRYAIAGVIGEGAQGATLDAIDKLDGTRVAIKRFQVRGARSWKDVELAEREARVLGRLAHPLVPRAIDHFEEDGALYLVMERIEGASLGAEPLRQRSEVVAFLQDMDEILGYLGDHQPPVIHRDIKPSNVIRRAPDPNLGETRDRYVLVDFGSVRDSLKPTDGSTVVGTFGYMAPEQFQGRALPVSDVYGVGATALRMLTGQEPESLPHRGLAIDVPAALGTKPDDALTRALEAMLAPSPDDRAASIGPLLLGLEARERTPGPPGPASSPPPESPREEPSPTEEPGHRGRTPSHADDRAGAEGLTLLRALYGPAVVIALAVARIAVAVATRVVVPVIFTLLAIVFGAGMKRVGRRVATGGVRADEALRGARDRALGRRPRDAEPVARDASGGPRVADPPPRRRVDEVEGGSEVEDDLREAAEEMEAAFDEAVEEMERAKRRRP